MPGALEPSLLWVGATFRLGQQGSGLVDLERLQTEHSCTLEALRAPHPPSPAPAPVDLSAIQQGPVLSFPRAGTGEATPPTQGRPACGPHGFITGAQLSGCPADVSGAWLGSQDELAGLWYALPCTRTHGAVLSCESVHVIGMDVGCGVWVGATQVFVVA